MEKIANVSFDEWSKLDLRVAQIKKVEDIEGADKLYKLTIDVGELGERVLCAGIKEHYSKDELIGKQIIVIANLEPRKIRGIESQGMLLAAVSEDNTAPTGIPPKSKVGGKVILLSPEKDVKEGMKVS